MLTPRMWISSLPQHGLQVASLEPASCSSCFVQRRSRSSPTTRRSPSKKAGITVVGSLLACSAWSCGRRNRRAVLRRRAQAQQERGYANPEALRNLTSGGSVSLSDLEAPENTHPLQSLSGVPLRILAFGIAFFAYPWVVNAWRRILFDGSSGVVTSELFSDAVSDFCTVEIFLFSTVTGVTLTVLLQRMEGLSTMATSESARLGALAEMSSALLRGHTIDSHVTDRLGLSALRAIWDQTTTIAFSSRDEELMQTANCNIYRRYKDAVLTWYRSRAEDGMLHAVDAAEVKACLRIVDECGQLRANRLSKESLTLPPTLFVTLAVFSVFILSAFSVREAAAPNAENDLVSRCAFSAITLGFTVFYNFAKDLNEPFSGDYQVSRSAVTAEIVTTRRIIIDAVGSKLASEWE